MFASSVAPPPRQRADDAPDRGQKSHVQHAVHFVEHQHLNLAQRDLAPAQIVFQPPRRRDDKPRPARELVQLRVLRQSAADQHCIVLRVRDQLAVGLDHLHRQLARRQQDQRADRLALALLEPQRVAVHVLDHRNQKAERLARAGRRGREDVAALERGRDRLRLHRSGRAEVRRAQPVLQRGGDVKVVEVNVFEEWQMRDRIDLDLRGANHLRRAHSRVLRGIAARRMSVAVGWFVVAFC